MTTVKIRKVKKEIESLSSGLTATDAQQIFYDIVFKKKVEEGLKEADGERQQTGTTLKKKCGHGTSQNNAQG